MDNLNSIGYCMKCREKREMCDITEKPMKNGCRALKGKCVTCGSVISRIVGKEKK